MDKLLQIGTVVRVKQEPEVLIMIMGYYPISDGIKYDYSGVLYPHGLKDIHGIFLISKEDIEEVVHDGYLDDAGDNMMKALPIIMDEMLKGM